MRSNLFKFKRFAIEQNNVSMRVNTDGVLLGAWYSMPSVTSPKVLDVGTGTGVIALMSAQRLHGIFGDGFTCEALEIDTNSCIQAQKNFWYSQWKKNLVLYCVDFKSFAEDVSVKYDAIVSNPPYFINSLKNPAEAKRKARHSESLPYEDFLFASAKLLKQVGLLSVILPAEEFKIFCKISEAYGFCIKRLCRVFSKESDSFPIRIMAEFQLEDVPCQKKKAEAPMEEDLCIMLSQTEYSAEYKSITKDFYLGF